MPDLIHELIHRSAQDTPDATALLYEDQSFCYRALLEQVNAVANALLNLGVEAADRVAIFLPKQPETVFSLFGASAAGACFVPINPLLRPRQLAHILPHCEARFLITCAARLEALSQVLQHCPRLETILLVDTVPSAIPNIAGLRLQSLASACSDTRAPTAHPRQPTDMAGILYTSGSTGAPRGVMLSHHNLLTAAHSVVSYLDNSVSDRLLALLPLSFDAGLSQLTTAFSVGASVVLIDHLVPREVIQAVVRHRVTGLAAVPSLWNRLQGMQWPDEAVRSLRYITTTGGPMPVTSTRALRKALPDTLIFLMYGLTEAFRSTCLTPEQIDKRPESIGKAIPHAEVFVINEQGAKCDPGEPGELVQCGPLVAMGYWNDTENTQRHFRPYPSHGGDGLPGPIALWSGDRVQQDEDGYLYFLGREDDRIKTSGYRVSPTEIEETAHDSGLVAEAAALGLPDTALGQAILLVVSPAMPPPATNDLQGDLMAWCRRELPTFMQPAQILVRDSLPLSENGKIDRQKLSAEYRNHLQQGQ